MQAASSPSDFSSIFKANELKELIAGESDGNRDVVELSGSNDQSNDLVIVGTKRKKFDAGEYAQSESEVEQTDFFDETAMRQAEDEDEGENVEFDGIEIASSKAKKQRGSLSTSNAPNSLPSQKPRRGRPPRSQNQKSHHSKKRGRRANGAQDHAGAIAIDADLPGYL